MKLTESEKQKIIEMIKASKPIPVIYKNKLFDSDDSEFIEATKDYRLVYKGKTRKEDIIAGTPVAPFQKVRSFNSDNSFDEDWRNMLIFGDNLLALKTIYDDQRNENRYKTKNRIKLIYIDPPFATKQDFMKDREKAYRDKIIGAQFIEFLRKRLILMREILADNGSIYVHLDWKKGHYIKAIMDEVFGEHNFQNEVIWHYRLWTAGDKKFQNMHDTVFFYTKSENSFFNLPYDPYGDWIKKDYQYFDEESGKRWRWHTVKGKRYKVFLEDENRGVKSNDVWEIPYIVSTAIERKITGNYPTQKPEQLLERIISASSNENDIILDAFAGSGTTLAVAEKLGRRWIGMDCGKLAIYTIQKRMLNLTTRIGSAKNDDRRDYERVDDFEDHSKNSRGLFFVYEKARRGDLAITDTFLKNFAGFISENLSGNKEQSFSLACPKDKFKVHKLKVTENEDGKAGEKIVTVGKVRFRISFILSKEKTEKEKPLKAKEFTLYNAGIYDNKQILNMDWESYKPFVTQLFGLRPESHKIHGFMADGYIGIHSAYIWDYPNQKNLILDTGYVKTLHTVLGGRAGNKFYVIAPVISMGFMEDEIPIDGTTYVFLKVPLSILMALIEKGEPGSLKQPVSENDVNEVIDAVGFDFISQPVVAARYCRKAPENRNLFNQDHKDFVIEITQFKSNTLVYDPEDFENFETLSMVLIDTNYNGGYFNLDNAFWADKILDDAKTKAVIRIPQNEFAGKKMLVIFMDKYGNELKVLKSKGDFK
ncbi:MAG: site-specific DNA-methyltransferase [Candidatus Desulfaltia sp.]|nr:site-specific DNA-methyltransferase [Candidatus Desulfaltia sp.]